MALQLTKLLFDSFSTFRFLQHKFFYVKISRLKNYSELSPLEFFCHATSNYIGELFPPEFSVCTLIDLHNNNNRKKYINETFLFTLTFN